MKKSAEVAIYIFAFILICSPLLSRDMDRWARWLEEVAPIMSGAERAVFDSLATEEDRIRFQRSFWMVRDPDPASARNEYMVEYYERLRTARGRLGGVKSDRGRIYMILGEPDEQNDFSGSDRLVDCQLWIYRDNGRSGFPPVMTLIFYRPRNLGEYRLFYPGAHSALDIVSPGYSDQYGNSRLAAYRDVRGSFPDLAAATLSLIPGEGDPRYSSVSTSSNLLLSRIFSLPEREAGSSYLNKFRSLSGSVDVATTFRELNGYAALALCHTRGYRFLNYSVLTDSLRMPPDPEGGRAADLELLIRLEDSGGKTVFQKENRIRFRLSDREKSVIDRRKASFSGFIPITEGDFRVFVTFSNRTTEEYYSVEEELRVGPDTPGMILGYQASRLDTESFMPLRVDDIRVYSDPRMVFNKSDILIGFITPPGEYDVRLAPADASLEAISVTEVTSGDRYVSFRRPLEDLKSGYYHVAVFRGGREVQRRMISVQPYVMVRPKPYEWSEPASAGPAFVYDLGLQNLNLGRLDDAIRIFESIPDDRIEEEWVPVIARAYYLSGEYEEVIERLEPESVPRDYPVLLMLGNASLETRDLSAAAGYFEALRKYGDSARINRTLGAIHLSLGDREKARVYFERAERLESGSPVSKKKRS